MGCIIQPSSYYRNAACFGLTGDSVSQSASRTVASHKLTGAAGSRQRIFISRDPGNHKISQTGSSIVRCATRMDGGLTRLDSKTFRRTDTAQFNSSRFLDAARIRNDRGCGLGKGLCSGSGQEPSHTLPVMDPSFASADLITGGCYDSSMHRLTYRALRLR